MAKKRKTLPADFRDLLETGDLAALQAVFDKCELDARGGYSKTTALGFADCPDDLARWLVGQGLDVDTSSLRDQRTPLHERASGWRSIAVLIELGADVNVRDSQGSTPMHAAAMVPHNLEALISGGAEVDPVARRSTPLRSALISCENAQIAMVAESAAVLIAAGAAIPDDASELVTQIGTRLEFARSKFNPDFIEETDAGLRRLYELFDVEPVPRRLTHDGTSRIEVDATDTKGQYAELWALLVPVSGPATIVQGEVLRLAGKLSREIDGNGSINWNNDFRSMTDALGVHLASGKPVDNLDELAPMLGRIRTGNAPQADLACVRESAVAWVLGNPDPTPLPTPSYAH
ncbi:hypothetical protein BJ980_001605 [Nocardioides daedukensis]|uniref:Ankyrin repeat domain-containing protein n=1 Tax=Nocardioides daedukensis TaxID=634462 RepID=A0A7Y9S1B8_9ACTN|nr:hypothetical protein [Nocardioides daedukensis]NYG58682.1 hypothetical protein [Nocardioides daedukensis]